MEATRFETLLLSTWEEEGFVGKTRVPLGQSDVDVLAIHAGEDKVRIGESKVREGSQKVYVMDDSSFAYMATQPHNDFTSWMGDWSSWLGNLPKLWDKKGHPAVPWLLDITKVKQIEVVFCCNIVILCDVSQVNESLVRAVNRFMRHENHALAHWLDNGGSVHTTVKPTMDVVTDLVEAVFKRIGEGYGRRFANHFKDLFREVHRYLLPSMDRLPYDGEGQRLDTRKRQFEEQTRKKTALKLLKAMGIELDELRKWVAEPAGADGGQ